MPGILELRGILSGFEFVVGYQPLRTEVPVGDFVPRMDYVVPARAIADPGEEARAALEAAAHRSAAVLLPGRRFDAAGTRHGQGGGWYDRFLAEAPRDWLRIGFCYDDQFSHALLPRQPWDQAMDYIVVIDRKTGAPTLYSSEGRPNP